MQDFHFEPENYLGKWHFYCFDRNLGEDFGFEPVRNAAADMNDPWISIPVRLKGPLLIGHSYDEVELVPMGSTVLRRVTLPVGQHN